MQSIVPIGVIALIFILQSTKSIHCEHQSTGSDSDVLIDEDLGKFYEQNETAERGRPPNGERKCVPMLSSLSPPPAKPGGAVGGESNKTVGEFAFPISDITVPLNFQQAGGGPIQSAMRLLSVFEKQIYGDEEDELEMEEEEGGEDGGGEQQKANTIQFQQNRLSLSGLNLTILNVHLYNDSEPKFGLGVSIKNTTLYGRFRYNGPTPSLLAGGSSFSPLSANHPDGQLAAGSSSRNGRSKLNGVFRMSIDNLLIVTNSNLSKQEVTEKVPLPSEGGNSTQVRPIPLVRRFRFVTHDFDIGISNLGYISIDILDPEDPSKPTSNYLLRMLQRLLQKTIKRIYYSFEATLQQTMKSEARRFLDCELTRFGETILEEGQSGQQRTPKQIDPNQKQEGVAKNDSGPPTTTLQDLSNIINSEITKLNLSKVGLPDFEHQRQIFGSNAKIYFTNGSLTGLNNFRLIGETKVKLQNGHLLVNASLGWLNLRPHYNWTLYLGDSARNDQQLGRKNATTSDKRLSLNATALNASTTPPTTKSSPLSSGFVAFNIQAIDFDAVISKGLVSNSKVIVEELTISRLDGLKMEFGGLPGMNRLARGVVNFFMGRLKQRLVSSIQPSLKRELELVLNRLPLLNQI